MLLVFDVVLHNSQAVRAGSRDKITVRPEYRFTIGLFDLIGKIPSYKPGGLGVDNIAAITTNEGSALLFKGGDVKAENQYFNKERARLISCATKGHVTKRAVNTRRLSRLSKHREDYLRDRMHKLSSGIIRLCVDHRIGTIVLGTNKNWKQGSNIGNANNQNFVQIPFAMLRFTLAYKAERVGIKVVMQEESYTSASDFLCRDHIPTYGVDDQNAVFSGRRVHRGLYKSGTGITLNADINGAANILRKAIPSAFDGVDDLSYLQEPKVVGF